MAKVLVLGATGFIGSHLTDALLLAGHNVVATYHIREPDIKYNDAKNIQWVNYALSSSGFILPNTMVGCDFIFHLLTTTVPGTSNNSPYDDLMSNVGGTLRILNSIRSACVKKIIFVSSGGTVYGIPQQIPITESHPTNPTSSYGIGKLTIEKYLSLYHSLNGIDYSIMRLANPYGPGQRITTAQGAVAAFLHKAMHHQPIEIWGDGSVTRDFIYIDDVITALIGLMNYTGNEHIFNVGAGTGTNLNQLVSIIEQVSGQKQQVNYKPGRSFDVPVNVLDITKIKQELNWKPAVTLVDGIRNTYQNQLLEILKS